MRHPASGPTSTSSTAPTSNPVAKGCSGLSAAFPTACATSTVSSSQKATMSSSTAAGHGQPAAWVAADVVRIENGVLAEHWDVLQDEATQAESKSGLPMFGDRFHA